VSIVHTKCSKVRQDRALGSLLDGMPRPASCGCGQEPLRFDFKVTEPKRSQAALLESEQRIRRLNEHILNMVMVLSHDIRGPVVAIAPILKLMLRSAYGKLDQSQANTVEDLLSRCARLLGTAEE